MNGIRKSIKVVVDATLTTNDWALNNGLYNAFCGS
jgi:hypothetical protein